MNLFLFAFIIPLLYKTYGFSIGRCGMSVICQKGHCCSQFGYCGTASTYCDYGCQKDFGRCNKVN